MAHNIEQLKRQVGMDNIADGMSDEKLDSIADELIKGFDQDEESRANWKKRSEDYLKLALQVTETKSTPWPNAANVKFPLLSVSSIQFNARMYPAMVSGFDVVKGNVVGDDKTGEKAARARRVSKHMSFQLLHEMDGWEDDMDTGMFVLPMVGTFFKKVYYDELDDMNRSDLVMPQDLVVNFYAKNLKEAERVTHIITQSTNEILENMAQGLYRDIGLFEDKEEQGDTFYDDTSRPSPVASVTPELGVVGEQHVDEVQGFTAPSEVDCTTPHEILEMHCWLDLDNDFYSEPYIVTLHKETNKILRIVARYEEAGIKSELDEDDEDILIKIEPLEYFVSYRFIPDPQSGVYGLGFGTLLGPINEAVNTLINQLIDSGTLSNLQSGWIAPGVKVKGGIHRFKPGEWKMAQFTGDNIANKIMPLPVREPSNTLYLLLGTLTQEANKISSVMDIMTGEMPGQNTKATVVLQAIEQGSKVFNAIAKRLYSRFTRELKLLYDLNRRHLDDDVYFNVLDSEDEIERIAADDYDELSVDVMPSADPTISSAAQTIAKLEAIKEFVGVTINPQEYTKRFVEAIEVPNGEELMKMPEPQPDAEFEFEKQKAMLEAQHREKMFRLELMKAQAQAAKNEADSLKTLSEIQDMIDSGEVRKAQQLLAERQQIIEARQQNFNNAKDVAQMQLNNQTQGTEPQSGEE